MSVRCDGIPAHIQKPIKNVKAYAEGVEYRLSGTEAAKPITDNPFQAGTEQEDCWNAGWVGAHAQAIEPCVAGYDRIAQA